MAVYLGIGFSFPERGSRKPEYFNSNAALCKEQDKGIGIIKGIPKRGWMEFYGVRVFSNIDTVIVLHPKITKWGLTHAVGTPAFRRGSNIWYGTINAYLHRWFHRRFLRFHQSIPPIPFYDLRVIIYNPQSPTYDDNSLIVPMVLHLWQCIESAGLVFRDVITLWRLWLCR